MTALDDYYGNSCLGNPVGICTGLVRVVFHVFRSVCTGHGAVKQRRRGRYGDNLNSLHPSDALGSAILAATLAALAFAVWLI